MSTTHVSASAIWRGGKLVMADVEKYRADLRKLKLGDGEAVTIRVERPEDAHAYAQLKYLFGYVFEPVQESSGHTKRELCLMAKAQFMPDGKTSLTELSHEEMDAFTKASELWLRMECPEAFQKSDERRALRA